MNKITRQTAQEIGIDFDSLLEDFLVDSYKEFRRGSNFFTKSIVLINEQWYSEVPREFDGYWETNKYVWDSDYGFDRSDIYELTRVEKKEKTVVTTYWEEVK